MRGQARAEPVHHEPGGHACHQPCFYGNSAVLLLRIWRRSRGEHWPLGELLVLRQSLVGDWPPGVPFAGWAQRSEWHGIPAFCPLSDGRWTASVFLFLCHCGQASVIRVGVCPPVAGRVQHFFASKSLGSFSVPLPVLGGEMPGFLEMLVKHSIRRRRGMVGTWSLLACRGRVSLVSKLRRLDSRPGKAQGLSHTCSCGSPGSDAQHRACPECMSTCRCPLAGSWHSCDFLCISAVSCPRRPASLAARALAAVYRRPL